MAQNSKAFQKMCLNVFAFLHAELWPKGNQKGININSYMDISERFKRWIMSNIPLQLFVESPLGLTSVAEKERVEMDKLDKCKLFL